MDDTDLRSLYSHLLMRSGERHASLEALIQGGQVLTPDQISKAALQLQLLNELDLCSLLLVLYADTDQELRQADLEEVP